MRKSRETETLRAGESEEERAGCFILAGSHHHHLNYLDLSSLFQKHQFQELRSQSSLRRMLTNSSMEIMYPWLDPAFYQLCILVSASISFPSSLCLRLRDTIWPVVVHNILCNWERQADTGKLKNYMTKQKLKKQTKKNNSLILTRWFLDVLENDTIPYTRIFCLKKNWESLLNLFRQCYWGKKMYEDLVSKVWNGVIWGPI